MESATPCVRPFISLKTSALQLFKQMKAWFEAREVCKAADAGLIRIDSEDTYMFARGTTSYRAVRLLLLMFILGLGRDIDVITDWSDGVWTGLYMVNKTFGYWSCDCEEDNCERPVDHIHCTKYDKAVDKWDRQWASAQPDFAGNPFGGTATTRKQCASDPVCKEWALNPKRTATQMEEHCIQFFPMDDENTQVSAETIIPKGYHRGWNDFYCYLPNRAFICEKNATADYNPADSKSLYSTLGIVVVNAINIVRNVSTTKNFRIG